MTPGLNEAERKAYELIIRLDPKSDLAGLNATILRLDDDYKAMKRQHEDNLCRWQVSEQKFVTEREASVLAEATMLRGYVEKIVENYESLPCDPDMKIAKALLTTPPSEWSKKMELKLRIALKAISDAQKLFFTHAEISKHIDSVRDHYSGAADRMTDAITKIKGLV